MKKALAVLALGSVLLAGCDDVVKGVARTIVENDEKQKAAQVAQPMPEQGQYVPVQPMQPVQSIQPINEQQIQTVQSIPQTVATQPVVTEYVAIEESVPAYTTDYNLGNDIFYVQTDTDGYIFMRNAPRTNAKKITKLIDGTPVTIISCPGSTVLRKDKAAYNELGKWCKVSANGYIGYVFDRYLSSFQFK